MTATRFSRGLVAAGRPLIVAVVSLAAYVITLVWAQGPVLGTADGEPVSLHGTAAEARSTLPASIKKTRLTPPPADPAPPQQMSDAQLIQLDNYLEYASKNTAEEGRVAAEMRRLLDARGVETDFRVNCSGALCRLSLSFSSGIDLQPLLGLRPAHKVGAFTYKLKRMENNQASLMVYTTLPDVDFAALLSDPELNATSDTHKSASE